MCFIVIAKLVKSARKQDQNSPLNRLARAFSTQESQCPGAAAPEIKDEERPIIKNDTEPTKPTLSKEVWLEDSDGNVAKLWKKKIAFFFWNEINLRFFQDKHSLMTSSIFMIHKSEKSLSKSLTHFLSVIR